MSRHMEIFVDTDDSLAALISWLESVLGIQFKPPDDTHRFFYYYDKLNKRGFDIWEHTLENDQELNFEDYRYLLDFYSPIGNGNKRWEVVQGFAQLVFAELKAARKYPLMLTDDIQIIIERYIP